MINLFFVKIVMPDNTIHQTEGFSVEQDAIDDAFSTYNVEENISTCVVDDYGNFVYTSPNYISSK